MGQAVTEHSARQNSCPEARVETASGNVGAVNRQPGLRDPYVGAHCIGSRCMHWQWMASAGADKKGYCGLSGRPGT
jgi:hypothetical protein